MSFHFLLFIPDKIYHRSIVFDNGYTVQFEVLVKCYSDKIDTRYKVGSILALT